MTNLQRYSYVFGLGGRGLVGGFSPATLFAASEQGVWYDPSDFSTMYQDSAGSIPVTAVGQPVGFLGDKSKGFALGPELLGNTTFDSTTFYGTFAGASISGGQLFLDNQASSRAEGTGNFLPSGKMLQIEVDVAANSGSFSIVLADAGGGLTIAGPTFSGTGIQRAPVFSGATNGNFRIIRSTGSATINSISIKVLQGNHAVQPTAASRPVLGQTAGGEYYLQFDGVDDFLSTANIDFSATDEMTVVAGVRKLSDAAGAMLIETSAFGTTAGSFRVEAPSGAFTNYGFSSRGSAGAIASVTGFAAPITNVVTGLGDISADSCLLRVNGAQVATSVADQGTGNFAAAQPLFIGRRGGTSLPFNGHLFGLVIRGKTTAGADLTNVEAFIAGKTGVTIP